MSRYSFGYLSSLLFHLYIYDKGETLSNYYQASDFNFVPDATTFVLCDKDASSVLRGCLLRYFCCFHRISRGITVFGRGNSFALERAAQTSWGQGCATALREVQLWVPEAVRAGHTVKLACDYNLEEAALYSIKWYRGDQEFYRYVPKESPPTRVFALPGIHVDISTSDARGVTLLDVQRQLSDFYKCEVSADAPLFHTEIKSAYMTVVEVPLYEPLLTVEKARYAAGERLRANCTSSPSFPAANITWFVNGQPVWSAPPTTELAEAGGSTAAGGTAALEIAVSALDLEVGSAMFLDARLHLRCVAWLFNVYRRPSVEYELQEDAPQLASVLGPSLSGATAPRPGVTLVAPAAAVAAALLLAAR